MLFILLFATVVLFTIQPIRCKEFSVSTRYKATDFQGFNPNSRYHPTILNGFKNYNQPMDLSGSESVDYAYQGGESQAGEVSYVSSEQDTEYGNSGYSYAPGSPAFPHPSPAYGAYLPSHVPYSNVAILPNPPSTSGTSPQQTPKQSPNVTYYYLGRHLWYIPLYFSIYFILYVGALVVKSVVRHKIIFPENLKESVAAGRALDGLVEANKKYFT